MDFTITVTDANQLLALDRALQAQNAQRVTPLTTAEYVQGMVTDQCTALAQQYLVKQMDPFTFLKTRFTSDERAAIRAAALTNGAIADLCAMVDKANTIHLDDPLTIEGINKLEAAGLIAAGRGAQILAP